MSTADRSNIFEMIPETSLLEVPIGVNVQPRLTPGMVMAPLHVPTRQSGSGSHNSKVLLHSISQWLSDLLIWPMCLSECHHMGTCTPLHLVGPKETSLSGSLYSIA